MTVQAKTRIEIDGAEGEGGGQVLRSALSLATVTGTAFRIADIRARRERPGLMRQHLAGGGRFTATALTDHARTNAAIVERFLPVRIALRERSGVCAVAVEPR